MNQGQNRASFGVFYIHRCCLNSEGQSYEISCLVMLSGYLGNDQQTEESNKPWKDAEFQPTIVAQYQFPEDAGPNEELGTCSSGPSSCFMASILNRR